MPPALLVALGGALGALARYGVGLAVGRAGHPAAAGFPWATLAVNLAGCFGIGLLAPLVARHDAARLFLLTGVLGGFTTFSTFGLDALALVHAGRTGAALAYAAASVVGGLGLCAFGWRLTAP